MTTSNQPQVQPYLFFNGRCDEALEFYKRALGAEVGFLMRFKDSPEPQQHEKQMAEKVMHATFQVGGTMIHASDGRCTGTPKFDGFALSLTVNTPSEAQRLFAALSDGGQVQMPIT